MGHRTPPSAAAASRGWRWLAALYWALQATFLRLLSHEKVIAREEQAISREEQAIARDEQTIARDEQAIARDEQAIAHESAFLR